MMDEPVQDCESAFKGTVNSQGRNAPRLSCPHFGRGSANLHSIVHSFLPGFHILGDGLDL